MSVYVPELAFVVRPRSAQVVSSTCQVVSGSGAIAVQCTIRPPGLNGLPVSSGSPATTRYGSPGNVSTGCASVTPIDTVVLVVPYAFAAVTVKTVGSSITLGTPKIVPLFVSKPRPAGRSAGEIS